MKNAWGLLLALATVVGGGGLLVLMALCGGLAWVMSGAQADRAGKIAEQTSTTQPAAANKHAPRTHAVGFRRMTFTYQAPDDSSRERSFLLWYPATGKDQRFDYNGMPGFATLDAPVAPGRHPLILFSHGFLGVADQSIFLTEAFARHGYIVASVNHADASNKKRKQPVAVPNFIDVKSWNATKFRDRRDDLVALLDHLLDQGNKKDSFLHGHVDRKAVGAAGHSLGGYTVMGTIGGWSSWKEPRVRAALLLSPYTMPFPDKPGYPSLRTPVMIQTATLDVGIKPFLRPTYTGLRAQKYYLVLKNETHFAWTSLISIGKTTTDVVKQGNAKLITDYSLAFFDKHLRGQDAPLLQTTAAGLASYEFEGESEG
jgi:predicted dienelactone hydrolase